MLYFSLQFTHNARTLFVTRLQAKALGDVLVVGLIPDSEILRCKGPPVLNERERYLLVDAVKWVDEVLQGEGRWLLAGGWQTANKLAHAFLAQP
jgi:glycerol-3-phosphate cytidylyltransferase-like family protein